MRRRLSTLLSAVSLVLCVATCVLWVRSYWVADSARDVRGAAGGLWDLTSEKGALGADEGPRRRADWEGRMQRLVTLHLEIQISILESSIGGAFAGSEDEQQAWQERVEAERAVVRTRIDRLMAEYVAEENRPLGPYAAHAVPYWVPAAVAAVLPAFWLRGLLRHRRGRRRVTAGLCPACDYDLRATPGRCPECGAAPAATPSK
jgi:hypothetical protein